MKKAIAFLVCCYSLAAAAQQTTTIQQLNGGQVSVAGLQAKLQHITDSAKIAGLQVAIINQNQLVWTSSFGNKDVERQLPLNNSTEMYAASLTKVVSAYLFLRLAEKGIFSLDTPVREYLKKPIGQYPKWKDLGDDTVAFNQITPRMLLSHSSGMPVLRALYKGKVNLLAKPGEKFYYSNEGMNFLGFMIEEYTGKRLEILAREEVFAPLHMVHTSMIWDTAFQQNFSYAYFKDGSKYGSERREDARAAGSMTTTASDYALFVINLAKQKGLSKDLYQQMLSPQIKVRTARGFGALKDSLTHDNDAMQLAWGLGIGLFQSSYGPACFHSGHGDANQNYFVSYPSKGIAVVLMSNSENFEHASALITNACIGEQVSPLRWLGALD